MMWKIVKITNKKNIREVLDDILNQQKLNLFSQDLKKIKLKQCCLNRLILYSFAANVQEQFFIFKIQFIFMIIKHLISDDYCE